MTRLRLLLLLSFVALSGCVKQQAVQSGLTDAGVRTPVARCMAAEMADRLSVAQLRKLSRAKARDGERTEKLTIADYVERARRVGDPEVIAVTGAAAAYCSATR